MSHRWRGHSTEGACFSDREHFYPQSLTLVCNCSQLPGAGRKKPLNIAEFLALLGVGGQYKGTNGPGKPRPLPQRNRMVQQNPRRRERRLARVGPDMERTQL